MELFGAPRPCQAGTKLTHTHTDRRRVWGRTNNISIGKSLQWKAFVSKQKSRFFPLDFRFQKTLSVQRSVHNFSFQLWYLVSEFSKKLSLSVWFSVYYYQESFMADGECDLENCEVKGRDWSRPFVVLFFSGRASSMRSRRGVLWVIRDADCFTIRSISSWFHCQVQFACHLCAKFCSFLFVRYRTWYQYRFTVPIVLNLKSHWWVHQGPSQLRSITACL